MDKFEKALDRIKKNVEIMPNLSEEDKNHYKTIIEALELASEVTNEKEAIEKWKKALKNNSTVFCGGKRYRIQALRLSYSKVLKSVIDQAELIDETPLNWNNVLTVNLDKVEVCE